MFLIVGLTNLNYCNIDSFKIILSQRVNGWKRKYVSATNPDPPKNREKIFYWAKINILEDNM